MATDPMERLRALALEGLPPAVAPAPARRRRRARAADPAAPDGGTATAREEIPAVLWDGAELAWRRAAHAWTPSLARLAAAGVVELRVRGCDLDVVMRNGTQRARGVEAPWVAVVVAALTGRELPAVRRGLRGGQRQFAPERSP